MAKPRSEWSASYRKRIEAAEARAKREGKAFHKQSARGHSIGEGKAARQARAFREINTSLTAREMTEVTKFFHTLNPSDQTEMNKQRLILEIDRKGWDWFKEMQATRRELLKTAKKGPLGRGVWQSLFQDVQLEQDTGMDWLLYYGGI